MSRRTTTCSALARMWPVATWVRSCEAAASGDSSGVGAVLIAAIPSAAGCGMGLEGLGHDLPAAGEPIQREVVGEGVLAATVQLQADHGRIPRHVHVRELMADVRRGRGASGGALLDAG